MFDKYFLSSFLPIRWRLRDWIFRLTWLNRPTREHAGTHYPHLIAGENMHMKTAGLTLLPAFNRHGNRPMVLIVL
ncbi:hypothetical protein YA35_02365 [Klebsiella aerogenes]|nr:hypothetical protein YA35_02365 [Klebsiella aerogenes]